MTEQNPEKIDQKTQVAGHAFSHEHGFSEQGFIRLALPTEADDIAALQRLAWEKAGLSNDLPSLDEAAQIWTQAIVAPPLATYRVLVAIDRNPDVADSNHKNGIVRGFTVIGPSDDPDAELQDALVGEFVISPEFLRQGHGSRLVNALVDTLRADGFVRATWWINATDDALRVFLESCGWAPDGAHQEIGDDAGHRVKQIRLHTALS